MNQLQQDLNENYPSSDFSILAVNEAGQESANSVAADQRDLPLLQDTDANSDGLSDAWAIWDVEYRDVWILDDANEPQDVRNLTNTPSQVNDLAVQSNYDALRAKVVEVATADREAASDWQNRVEPLDVTNDGFTAPNDVLTIFNRLNAEGVGQLPTPSGDVDSYFDTSGDGFATSLDALLIIRHLNLFSISGGSGEPPDAQQIAAAVDSVHADQDSSDDEAVAIDFDIVV